MSKMGNPSTNNNNAGTGTALLCGLPPALTTALASVSYCLWTKALSPLVHNLGDRSQSTSLFWPFVLSSQKNRVYPRPPHPICRMPPRFIIQDEGTIRETREEATTRPRKRQRTDSGIDTGGYSDNDCLASAGPVEDDPEFYRGEAAADCIVRVSSIRFKVSSAAIVSPPTCTYRPQFKGSLLWDVSPVFRDIVAKNHRPDTPLVLIVEADEFRALLWALYARYDLQLRSHTDLKLSPVPRSVQLSRANKKTSTGCC